MPDEEILATPVLDAQDSEPPHDEGPATPPPALRGSTEDLTQFGSAPLEMVEATAPSRDDLQEFPTIGRCGVCGQRLTQGNKCASSAVLCALCCLHPKPCLP